MMGQMQMLSRAVEAGVALVRRITPVHILVHVPDRSLACLLLDDAGGRLDYSKCAKMTRPQARRALRLLDAPQYVRDALARLIDGKPVRIDEMPGFIDYTSEGSDA